MKTEFNIPARDEVSPAQQDIFDNLERSVGFVPNLYAAFAHSDTALSTFITAQNAKSSLTAKEREAVSLIVSQVNDCEYCLSAHTVLARKNGFTDEQVLDIRRASAPFDPKLDALLKLAKNMAENRGHADPYWVNRFFAAGYTKANMIDLIVLIGIRSITNYVYAVTDVGIDWPIAPELHKPSGYSSSASIL